MNKKISVMILSLALSVAGVIGLGTIHSNANATNNANPVLYTKNSLEYDNETGHDTRFSYQEFVGSNTAPKAQNNLKVGHHKGHYYQEALKYDAAVNFHHNDVSFKYNTASWPEQDAITTVTAHLQQQYKSGDQLLSLVPAASDNAKTVTINVNQNINNVTGFRLNNSETKGNIYLTIYYLNANSVKDAYIGIMQGI